MPVRVHNRALAIHKARYAAGEKKLGHPAMCRELTAWRDDESTSWLADSPCGPEQQALRDLEVPVPGGGAVGLDLGIARFATLSDGTWHAPVNAYRTNETRLRKAQRAMSRKVLGSRNRAKATMKVRRIHARIANVRNDHLHKLSHAIGKSHAVVFVEHLQVRGMSGSATGTMAAPGVHTRSKAGLNKDTPGWPAKRAVNGCRRQQEPVEAIPRSRSLQGTR